MSFSFENFKRLAVEIENIRSSAPSHNDSIEIESQINESVSNAIKKLKERFNNIFFIYLTIETIRKVEKIEKDVKQNSVSSDDIYLVIEEIENTANLEEILWIYDEFSSNSEEFKIKIHKLKKRVLAVRPIVAEREAREELEKLKRHVQEGGKDELFFQVVKNHILEAEKAGVSEKIMKELEDEFTALENQITMPGATL